MTNSRNGTQSLVRELKDLPDPYRGNAIEWLRTCTKSPLNDFETDMEVFLDALHPGVRTRFLISTQKMLRKAARYFGR